MNPRIEKLKAKKAQQEKIANGGKTTFVPDERKMPPFKYNKDGIFKITLQVMPDKDLDAEPVQSQYSHWVTHPSTGKPRKFPCVWKSYGKSCPICAVGAGIHKKLEDHSDYVKLDKLVSRSPENYVNVFVIDCTDESLVGNQYVWSAPNVFITYLDNQIEEFEVDPFDFESTPILVKVEKGEGIKRDYSINDDKKYAKKSFDDILESFDLSLDVVKENLADLTDFVYDEEEVTSEEKLTSYTTSLKYIFKDIYADVVEMEDEEREDFFVNIKKQSGYKASNSVSEAKDSPKQDAKKAFTVDSENDLSPADFDDDFSEDVSDDDFSDDDFGDDDF